MYLKSLSDQSAVDLIKAALELAALEHSVVNFDRYHNHIQKLSDQVGARYEQLIEAGSEDNAETQLASLKHILFDTHDYRLDIETPEHIQNLSLIRCIDRGKGGSRVLALLYVYVARMQGWRADILAMPDGGVCRIGAGSIRLMFDAGDPSCLLAAPDLRSRIKKYKGPYAELSSNYFEPLNNREILVILQNQVKLEQIEVGDYEAALRSVEAMRWIDSQEYRLLLDAGVLYSKIGFLEKAIPVLREYIEKAPNQRDRAEARMLLLEIEEKLQEG